MIEILELLGIATTRPVSHPFTKATPPPAEKKADTDEDTVLKSWGDKEHRPKRRVHYYVDTTKSVAEWAMPTTKAKRNHMPEQLTKFDEQEIKKLGGTTAARDNYSKARTFVIQGASNPDLADKLGWSLSTAQKVGARVRAAIKKYNENPTPTQ